VAILTETDGWSASTRQRAEQHVPALRRHIATVDLLVPRDSVPRRPGRLGQAAFFAAHARRYAERALQVRRIAGDYDALLVQRGLYPLGPGAIAAAVERFDGRVVYDLDDAVFELRPPLDEKGWAARWLWGPQQARRLLRRADAVVVSTPTLAEMLPPGTVEPVVLPTVPDPARYAVVRHDDRHPVLVGWAGTVEGLRYLEPLTGVFARLARDGVAELSVVSSHPWAGPGRFTPWRRERASALFGDFAIGIMPLADTPYARAKAGFKLLEYMAAGLPVVASPVGVNTELVERSGAGILAGDEREWEAALRELAGSAELRRELGARGRSFLEGYADLDGQAGVLARLLCP
jgi:hypothetical protein